MDEQLTGQTLTNENLRKAVAGEPERIVPFLERFLEVQVQGVQIVEGKEVGDARLDLEEAWLDLDVEDTDGVKHDALVRVLEEGDQPCRGQYFPGLLEAGPLPPKGCCERLQKTCFILICDHDPYGRGRFVYTFRYRGEENYEIVFNNMLTVVINMNGEPAEGDAELKEVIASLIQ